MLKWVTQRNLALAACLAAVTAVAAGFLGAIWPPLDILSHMRTHFVGGAFVALAAIIWPRRGIALMVMGGVVVLMAHSAVAWMQQEGNRWAQLRVSEALAAPTTGVTSAAQNAAFKTSLKILSYNTWHSNKQLARLEKQIEQIDADIVVLSEFGRNKRYMLDAWRDRYPYQAECTATWSCSVAILSKHPILKTHIQHRGANRAPTVVAKIGVAGRTLNVVGTHLFRPIDGPRRQKREVRSLSRLLHSIEGDIILAGDFNATRWSSAFQTLVKNTSLKVSQQFLPSWPRILPQLAIDHVLTRGKLKITDLKLAANGGSDHIGILSQVELRN